MGNILEIIKAKETLNEEEEFLISNIETFFLKKNVDFSGLNLADNTDYNKLINLPNIAITKEFTKIEKIEEAAALFIKYLKSKDRIIILTDNDLDGTSARGIATSVDLYLKQTYGYKHIYENYFTYGRTHGITFEHVDELLNDNQDKVLIVTADNGINNKPEIELIKEKYPNAQVIITDHHIANETEGVFDIVDYVIDPEAIAINTKSKFLTISIEGKDYTSSYSGGYVFYLFMKEILEQLNISNDELNSEIETTALFSNIGDMINYNLDIMQDLKTKSDSLLSMYLINEYKESQDFFNQIPDDKMLYKIKASVSKVISIFNSSRRLNSILKNYHLLDETGFSNWMQENFGLDIKTDVLDGKTLLEYLNHLNKQSKKVYTHFIGPDTIMEKNIVYSYIKEMPVFLLMNNNSHKTENDNFFFKEAYTVLNLLNKFKNYIKTHIVDKKLYKTYKNDIFEVYYSLKGSYLREILSIQAFIEVDKRKSFLTLAETEKEGFKMINGSMRSKEYMSFKYLFQEDKDVAKLLNEYGLTVDIFGHDMAAGIFFYRDKKDFDIAESEKFFKEFYSIIDSKVSVPEIELNQINVNKFNKIDPVKYLRILSTYFYVVPQPYWTDIKLNMSYKEIVEHMGNIELKKAKSGISYFNIKDHAGNTYLYFEQKNGAIPLSDNTIFETDINVKYNSRSDTSYFEFILNPI
jgi:single-stranded DNA-specific DHH superfamily exonuclease